MSVSLSATVAIPGIPRFYKSNVQGSNKSISVIPEFLNGLYLDQNERSGQSEVEYTLLGVKREESKSILLESTFIYGVDLNLWSASSSFAPTNSENSWGYCSILNSVRGTPNPRRSTGNPFGYLIMDRRIRGNQILGGVDATFDPTTLRTRIDGNQVPVSSLTTFEKEYVHPVIYHNSQGSCVTMEGFIDPYITPWWDDFPGEYCGQFIYTNPFDATLSFETSRAFRYEPGKATTFTMGVKIDLTGGTGILDGEPVTSQASWGARNDTDTYRFILEGDGEFSVERRTPYAETTLRTYRKDFIDPLDGTGPSGLTIDFSKVTMYSIEFSWYGAIGANFYVYVPVKNGEAKWIKIASLLSSNRYTKPSLSSPNMRLFTELYIPMGCTKIQSMSLYGSSVYIDGNFRDTLKYFTSSAVRKPVTQQTNTYITLEIPNFLDGEVFRPRNNANDFPKILNGISTVDTQIDMFESTAGGSPDIVTAYYETSEPARTRDEFLLLSNITNGNTRQITLSAIGKTQEQKIDFMRRATNTYFVYTNPVTAYERFSNAGAARLSGAQITNGQSFITSVSSQVNSDIIDIFLDVAPVNPFYAFVTTNTTAINQRNALATTYPVICTYPSIPNNSIMYSPTMMARNRAIMAINTNARNNRSFILNRRPIKRGIVSFDTDVFFGNDNNMQGMFGIISESEYQKIRNNNHYLTELNVVGVTQTVSTSPIREFTLNSELFWRWQWGRGNTGLIPAVIGLPPLPPFFVNGQWVFNQAPQVYGTYSENFVYTTTPLAGISTKVQVSTLIDYGSFTVNVDIRDHEYYFYTNSAQIVAGPDTNFTYIRTRLQSKDLFSIEEGSPTNNLYNFKLLLYGHNGLMATYLTGRRISSIKGNWDESNTVINSITVAEGTSYSKTDAYLETDGALYCTVRFPRTAVTAINAFIANPNFKLRFKSVFFRNNTYRSPTAVQFRDRNAGLWYSTFFIPTLEPVHVFMFLPSKFTSTNNTPQQLLQSVAPISRPMLTNFQQFNAIDKNNIPQPETPQLTTVNTTLVRQITSTENGVLNNLPSVNFNFTKILGVNAREDTSTTQILNTRQKVRRFTFLVNANIPFTYDLSSVYGNGRNILNPLVTGILNRDFKRFFVTARTITNESFGSPWFFSLDGQAGTTRTPFSILNPQGTAYDAALFSVDTRASGKNVYIANTLKTAANSDLYFIWSIYAKSITPTLSAGRFIVFELKTGESNTIQRWQPVVFDIIDNKIGFSGQGLQTIAGGTNVWQNRYDNVLRQNISFNDQLQTNTNWFSAAKSSSLNTKISGYANLDNKNNGRYVVSAHIEELSDGWKRLSTCTYYKNNHNDNVVYLGNYTSTLNTFGNVSLWGFKEEVVTSDSTIDVLSSWYPSAYVATKPGTIALNLTTGEQL